MKCAAWAAIGMSAGIMAFAADWLSRGGDPQGSGWQRYGKGLTAENVTNLKLLWKRKLSETPAALLSAPVIIGPTITHRGVRELVFVADAHDNLYAVDADLGTLFWKRHFDVASTPNCGSGIPPAPVIEPDPEEDFSGDPVTDDEADDEAGPMRPLYAVASDGRLHNVRMSDGADAGAPVDFLPAHADYSSLNFWDGAVFATSRAVCKGSQDGIWSIQVTGSGAKPAFYAAKSGHRIVIGPSGGVNFDGGSGTISLDSPGLKMKQLSKLEGVVLTAFRYQGRELLASAATGRLLLLDGANLHLAAESQISPGNSQGIATWQDAKGVRWLYAATDGQLKAFQVTGPPDRPRLEYQWAFDAPNLGSPAITNGLVLLLSRATDSTTLLALDSATGKQLFSSTADGLPSVPELAVANGHVCFGTSDGTLHCFGIPLER